MKKNVIFIVLTSVSTAMYGQVGINTPTPKATLDVVGKPTDVSTLDGVIAPRITGVQLRAKAYTGDQTGALVYVTSADTAPAGQTVDVTSTGYYYFDGTKWIKTAGAASPTVNIYNADGSLTNGRTLDLNSFPLNFTGTDQQTNWDPDGSINQRNMLPSSGQASMSFLAGNDSNLAIQQYRNSNAQILANGNSTDMIVGTSFTTLPASLRFDTSPGSNLIGEERMVITGQGNVGIKTSIPTEILDNAGITRLRNLPLNGATNAIFTNPSGVASAIQDQTFTATRTVVADANGVLGYVTNLPQTPLNLYNANGSLTSSRTLDLNSFPLSFIGTDQRTLWGAAGSIFQRGTGGTKRASVTLSSDDNDSNTIASRISIYQDPEGFSQVKADLDSRGLNIGTTATTLSAPIYFTTSSGSNANGTQKMIITGEGNVGVNTGTPTEKFDNSGITRLRNLPANGATNAIYTNSGGTASATQDQTFTATRTVVADANGVLGYVSGLGSVGTSRVIVSTSVPGTQTVGAASPNPNLVQYPNENIDTESAWTNNIFTVPTGMSGIFIVSTQLSNIHTTAGETNNAWFNVAAIQKSTNGGTSWSDLTRDTSSNNLIADVDNGNMLYWTGILNDGDKVRIVLLCNSVAINRIDLGSITITRLNQ